MIYEFESKYNSKLVSATVWLAISTGLLTILLLLANYAEYHIIKAMIVSFIIFTILSLIIIKILYDINKEVTNRILINYPDAKRIKGTHQFILNENETRSFIRVKFSDNKFSFALE